MTSANTPTKELSCGLLSRKQVAGLLGVCSATVKRYQARGQLPAVVLNCRLVRYRLPDVEQMIQQGRVA